MGALARVCPSGLVLSYKSRDALVDSIVINIQPAGFFVPTPFAALVGTTFLIRPILEQEGECADIPATVVTSITQGPRSFPRRWLSFGTFLG